jgi:uncharacterized protein YabE (DUF348 family)
VLSDALKDFQLHELSASKLSVSRSATLPRTGLSVEVTTPKEITLKVGGEKETFTTTAETVADLLIEESAEADADDILKPAAQTRITEGLTVVLDKVEVTTKTKTEKIPFETTTQNDSSILKGQSRVITAGKNGKAERTYEITKVNGKQTDSKLVTETILKKPVDAVKAIGTKVEKVSLSGVWVAIPAPSVRRASITASTSSPSPPGVRWAARASRVRPQQRSRPSGPKSCRPEPAGVSGPPAHANSACASGTERPAA